MNADTGSTRTFGDCWRANISKFHQFFEEVLCPWGTGCFWLMVMGGAGWFGWGVWVKTGEAEWWRFFQIVGTLLAVVCGWAGGALGGVLALIAGAVVAAIVGYSTCFIAAMAQPIQDRLETRRREREEMVEAIKKFLEANRNRQKEEVELEEAKRREWEERRDERPAMERTVRPAPELDRAALRREASDLCALMARLENELNVIDAPSQERSGLAGLRRSVEVELEEAIQREDWFYVKETMAAAQAELSGYRHVDRSLAVLGLTRFQLSPSALKKRYFDQAKRFHPDAGGAGGGEQMVQLNRAREILERYLHPQPEPV